MATMAQRLTNALQLQAAGRLAEAEPILRELAREAPRQAEFVYALGLVLHEKGEHREAIDLLEQALAARGPHPVIHCNLGAAYLAAAMPREAITHCREAIRLQPGLATAHFNLGAALRHLDCLEETEGAFRTAARLAPDDLSVRCNLGVVLHKLGRNAEAIAVLEETVRLAPTHAQARHDLGSVLIGAGKVADGVTQLREAVRLRPDFVDALDNLGLGLRYLNQLDEAVGCFQQALRLRPQCVKARNNLASTLQAQGKIEESVQELRTTIRFDPENAYAIHALSKLIAVGHFQFSEDELHAIAQLAAQEGVPLDDRHQLHFALGDALHHRGDYPRAFAHYAAGNEVRKTLDRRQGATFDPDAHDAFIDRLIAAYTPAHFERVRGFCQATNVPVFIVGMMRSGTTLAEQILASHPRVHGAGELAILDMATIGLGQRLGVDERYPENMRRLDMAAAQALAREIDQGLRAWAPTAQRVIDKLPSNFFHLGFVATILPRARIIHCRRDPLDTCLSCYFQNFGGPIAYARDLGHLGRFYRGYARLMRHWAAVLPMPVFALNYEDLIANQEEVSRRLVAFCGLDWDERCLRFHETQRPVRTASVLQVRQPLYRSAVGRWKRYEAYLGPLREALGDAYPNGEPRA